MGHIDSFLRFTECWVNSDTDIDSLVAEDIVYETSGGGIFNGIDQLKMYMKNWFRHGVVRKWSVHDTVDSGVNLVCKWNTECEFDTDRGSIVGVCWMVFDDDGKICTYSEYTVQGKIFYPFSASDDDLHIH